jgi:hypothetical protein
MSTSCASTSKVHVGPRPLEQGALHEAQLAPARAHEVLPAAAPNRCEIGFADNAAVQHPDPPGPPVLALDHPHDGLERRDVGPVAVEGFVTERKPVDVDDHREHDLQAIPPMIAAVPAM